MFSSLLAGNAKWYPLLFDSPLNAARSVAIWLTLAFFVAFVVSAIVLKGEKRTRFLKIGTLTAIGYAAALSIILLSLTFAENELITILFIPGLILVLAIAASAAVLFFIKNRVTYAVCGSVTAAALIALFVCMGVHYASGDSAIINGLEHPEYVNQIGLYVSAALLIAIVVSAAFLTDRRKGGFDTKSISYAAVCIAMSFALSYLRVVKMPQGGSITIASLVPLMLYSFMFGPKKGVFAGMAFGILQAFQDPYILHPAQFVLDYPAAFAGIGLAGVFSNFKALDKYPQVQFILGGVVAGMSRFIMHYISGVFAFSEFAGEQSAWIYSLIYQSGYVLPDIAIAIVVGAILLCSPTLVAVIRKVSPVKTAATEKAQTDLTREQGKDAAAAEEDAVAEEDFVTAEDTLAAEDMQVRDTSPLPAEQSDD